MRLSEKVVSKRKYTKIRQCSIYVTTAPPKDNCTNPRTGEFALFLLYESFGLWLPITDIKPRPPKPKAWQTTKRTEKGKFTK